MSIKVSSVSGTLLAWDSELSNDAVQAAEVSVLIAWASGIKKNPSTFKELMTHINDALGQLAWNVVYSSSSPTDVTSDQVSSAIWTQASSSSTVLSQLQQFVAGGDGFAKVGDFWWTQRFNAANEIGVGIAAVESKSGFTSLALNGFSLPPAGWHRLLTAPSKNKFRIYNYCESYNLNSEIWDTISEQLTEKSKKVQNLVSETVSSAN